MSYILSSNTHCWCHNITNRISQKKHMNYPLSKKKKQFLNCALKDYIFYGYQI